jgi:hypothetical protein
MVTTSPMAWEETKWMTRGVHTTKKKEMAAGRTLDYYACTMSAQIFYFTAMKCVKYPKKRKNIPEKFRVKYG